MTSEAAHANAAPLIGCWLLTHAVVLTGIGRAHVYKYLANLTGVACRTVAHVAANKISACASVAASLDNERALVYILLTVSARPAGAACAVVIGSTSLGTDARFGAGSVRAHVENNLAVDARPAVKACAFVTRAWARLAAQTVTAWV